MLIADHYFDTFDELSVVPLSAEETDHSPLHHIQRLHEVREEEGQGQPEPFRAVKEQADTGYQGDEGDEPVHAFVLVFGLIDLCFHVSNFVQQTYIRFPNWTNAVEMEVGRKATGERRRA